MTGYQHARDIPNEMFLSIVDRLQREDATARQIDVKWVAVMRWEVAEQLGAVEYRDPLQKVVLAKARRLIRRGLLSGCYCGCRGDLSLTDAGRAMLDAESHSNG